jgi:hypothetical protein
MHAHATGFHEGAMPIHDHLTSLGPRFVSQVFSAPATLLPLITLPFGLQRVDDFAVLHILPDVMQVAACYRANLLEMGVSGLRGRVAAFELPRAGRYRLWVDIDYLGTLETERAEQIILYCSQDRGTPRIDMAQWLTPCMPVTAISTATGQTPAPVTTFQELRS